MKQLFTSLFLFIVCQNIHAQEELGEINTEILSFINLGQVHNYSAVNSKTNELATLITVNGKMNVHLTDSSFKEIAPLLERRLNNGFKNYLVGHKTKEKEYSFIYSNKLRSGLTIFSFDFKSRETKRTDVDLGYKGERIIEAFSSFNNRFFVFFGGIDNHLIVRELNKENDVLVEIGRFKIEDFKIGKKKIRFRDHFLYSKAYYQSFTDKIPTNIYNAQHKYKKYENENTIVFTCENVDAGTSIYAFDINSLNLQSHFVPYPEAKIKSYATHNSYISGGLIFQISADLRELNLKIADFKNEIKKEYYVTKDDEITFTNTVMSQKGTTALPFQNKREFDKTSKLLRKVAEGTVGVFVHQKNERYEITFGGTRDNMLTLLSSAAISVPTPGILIPTGSNDKTVKVTGLFDSDFEHIDEDLEMNTFDLIEEFQDDLSRDFNANLFSLSGQTIYSYIDKKNDRIRFIGF